MTETECRCRLVDVRHGLGTFRGHGHEFRGQFAVDRVDGQGEMRMRDGTLVSGRWRNGSMPAAPRVVVGATAHKRFPSNRFFGENVQYDGTVYESDGSFDSGRVTLLHGVRAMGAWQADGSLRQLMIQSDDILKNQVKLRARSEATCSSSAIPLAVDAENLCVSGAAGNELHSVTEIVQALSFARLHTVRTVAALRAALDFEFAPTPPIAPDTEHASATDR